LTGSFQSGRGSSLLRILHLEDDPLDAGLVEATLESEGIACVVTRADTRAAFLACLEQGQFDLILADYTLPAFDGISALSLAQERRPDLPFIFVSGTLAEDTAIEALKLGATDYVLKTRLSRIAPSVRRALRETQQRSRRQQAETALERSQAYLAKAQRISRTGSFGWRLSNGELYWSEETYRIFGVDPAASIGLDSITQRTHPDDRESVRQVIDTASTEKKEFDFEHRLLMADGSVKYLRVVGYPQRIESGDLEFVGAVTDITDRKNAERELQQLVDLVPQLIVVLNAEGKWIHANRVMREYTGLTPERYMSEGAMAKVVHPDDVQPLTGLREQGFQNGKPFELEVRLKGKDGAYRWFLFRYNPLVEDGAVRRWYATATEIESRKQEEERVRKENVRLEERTRIAQELHDTLLQTFLSASLQLTSAMHGLPAELPIKPRLDRILQVIEQGIAEGRNAILGLRSAIANTADLGPALSRVQQELEVPSCAEFRVYILGSEQALQPEIQDEAYRIGKEALSNAFRHSGANCVALEIEYGDQQLCLRIRDNGRGMDPQTLENGREGHWGLAGMRERAARIGGTLNISSNPGAGTGIELTIPHRKAFIDHRSGLTAETSRQ
jgi:PAS domain S-box-containing protein